MDSLPYGESYFEGKDSNYWWTVGSYGNLRLFPHWEEILARIRRYKDGGRLLDIGCAYGFFVKVASRRFQSYGIDVSSFAVHSSKSYCRGTISKASADTLPFKSESFDVVTLIDTLEHVPDLDCCLQEVTRVLKSDGLLLLQVPNPLIWTHLCARLCPRGELADETHFNNYSLGRWKTILERHKFVVEESSGMVAFAKGELYFLLKSKRAASLFPEWWIVAQK